MHERKKTDVHGTMEMILLAWKLNSKQLLSKTLNSRMNSLETRAVLNILRKGKREMGLEGLKKLALTHSVLASLVCVHQFVYLYNTLFVYCTLN